MDKNKAKGIFLLFTIIVLSIIVINIKPSSVQAYEVSGFYQYENNDIGVTITKYTGGEFTVSIPSKIEGKNVTVIGERAFENNDIIESVKIPNTVTTIGNSAFKDCDSLLDITIPNSVTVMNSGKYYETFGYCDNLTKVVIGDGLLVIDRNCFIECPKLQNIVIGKNVVTIADGAFSNCDSIASIDIPASVKRIGESCFNDCGSLQIVNLFNGLETIGSSAFKNCDSLQGITIPDSVTTIYSGKYYETFGYCDNLTSVEIGDGLTKIDTRCFSDCPKLQSVTIGKNVISIEDSAFINCGALISIDIPASVKSIGGNCFENCVNLQSVNLHYGLETINAGAFQNCDSISEIIIPNSVINLFSGRYDTTFGYCDKLLKLQIPNSVTNIGERFVYESKNVIIYGYVNSFAAQYTATNNILFQELVSVPADSFSFKASELLVMVGQKLVLDFKIAPDNTTDAIVWKTSDANIASVDYCGVVTAKNSGSVSVIASTTSGKKASITVIVQEAPNTISFKTASKTLAVNQTFTQKAILDDGSRTDVSITYTSGDKAIASVSSSGKITAKKVGTVTITAEIFNGLKTTYQVIVKKVPTSVKLTPTKVTLNVKDTYTIKTTLSEGSYTSKYTYTSSNTSIATVDSKGKIVAKKKGTVKITVTTHNGKKASCIVTIK